MSRFAYAKPPPFYYQTFDRKTVQFTNVPLFSQPPKPPAFAKQDPSDDEGEPPKDEPKDDTKTDEQPDSPDLAGAETS